jgi:hypothetical protein
MKRTDIILSVGTLALAFFATMFVAATRITDEFAEWARHHNVLSWCIRPLFLLPFCYFAYERSLWGIVLTVVALDRRLIGACGLRRLDPVRHAQDLARKVVIQASAT